MSRRGDLLVSFPLALALHVLAASMLILGVAAPPSAMLQPLFCEGASSVRLTLVSASAPRPPAARTPMEEDPPIEDASLSPPVAEPMTPEEPAVDTSSPEPVIPERPPMPEAAVDETPAPPFPEGAGVSETIGDVDADLQDKGVESGLRPGRVRPRYPVGSRMRGEEGTVHVRVTVDAQGRARKTEIVISSGFEALDRAAVEAAGRARYVSEDGGEIRAGETDLVFSFRLTDT